ncbi:MAG: aminodeoxychorismate synthase component I [Draconibacterium sp.]|nr:aminodeoxychorismate synthase component I [Draconibacterium sp.]
MQKQKHIINKLNLLGEKGEPFVFIVDFEGDTPHIFHPDEAEKILWETPKSSNYKKYDINKQISEWSIKPVSFQKYQRGFKIIQNHIHNGDTYLLNFTQPTKIKTNLNLEEIFYLSSANYKIYLKNTFVCFSPETFVKIDNGKISSYPMKGTIDATIENAKEVILSDSKELAEHNTIVDLIRNDLSLVAENVKVEKFRYLERIKTNRQDLWQVSSKITGVLPENYAENIGDIIYTMLPAGSVSGAPKKKTVEIIRNTENYTRGFYTGIFCYFDGKNLDSCVLIRYIENQNGQLIYKSGGGITFKSKVEPEYDEMLKKIYIPISVHNLNSNKKLVETIKCEHGRLLNLSWHNLRLNGTRKKCIGLNDKIDLGEIITVPENCKKGIFRCRVVYSETINTVEFIPHKYRKIESLKLIEDNNIDYQFKYSNRKNINNLFEKRGDCDDILIVKNGCITDSSTANCIFYDGQKWWTPDTPLLPGTQRARLISDAKVSVCRITVESISKYKKVGLINAMWSFENMPVIEIENIHFNSLVIKQ